MKQKKLKITGKTLFVFRPKANFTDGHPKTTISSDPTTITILTTSGII